MSLSAAPAVWFLAVRAGTGADTFTETLAAELQRRGFRAEITWLPLRAEYAPWSVPIPRPPAWANIAHVNTWLSTRFLPAGLPVVATVHHCVHDPEYRQYKSLAQAIYHRVHIKQFERRILERADAVVAVSWFTAERTRAAFGPIDVRIITLGIDLDGAYRPPVERKANDPFRLLFAGTGSRRKGVDLLVPIMERLGPQFMLTVVGTSQIGQARLPKNIRIRGRLCTKDDLAAAYCDSDALLFPSRLEGFGLVAAEAMACGVPVIATRGSSLTEVIEDGVTGILCTQDDVGAFVAAARKLADDAGLAAAMSRSARQRAIDLFSAARMIDGYVNVYESCLCNEAGTPVSPTPRGRSDI